MVEEMIQSQNNNQPDDKLVEVSSFNNLLYFDKHENPEIDESRENERNLL
jgi:hypothetical protein